MVKVKEIVARFEEFAPQQIAEKTTDRITIR